MRQTLLVTVGCVMLLAGRALAQDASLPATVYQTVNVRSGPSVHYEIVGQLVEGDRVQVVGRSEADGWLQVTLATGQLGWVAAFVLLVEGDLAVLPVIATISSEGEGDTVTVTAFGRVNVRRGPGITYDLVGQLDVDDEALALARSNYLGDWLYVERDELAGWVAHFTVNVHGNVAALPVRLPEGLDGELVLASQLLMTRFNIRLHSEPDLASPTLLVIPFDNWVLPLARSADGAWLFVAFEGASGWGLATLFTITPEQLAALPEYSASLAVTPTAGATAAPLSTSAPVEVTPEATDEAGG